MQLTYHKYNYYRHNNENCSLVTLISESGLIGFSQHLPTAFPLCVTVNCTVMDIYNKNKLYALFCGWWKGTEVYHFTLNK